MKRIGITSSGNIIVEMTPREWLRTTKGVSSMEDLASLTKRYRQENNVSQTTLARKVGLSRNTIYAVEQGKLPTITTVERILSAIAGEGSLSQTMQPVKNQVKDRNVEQERLPLGKKMSNVRTGGKRKGRK